MSRRLGSRRKEADDGMDPKELDVPRPYVATPAYNGMVNGEYAQSMLETGFHCSLAGIWPSGTTMGNNAFIDLSRNMFVKMFLDEENEDCTHLFFIDSDLKWEPRAFVGLVAACTEDRPVVAGVYPKRQDKEEYPCRWIPNPNCGDDVQRLWYDEDGWLMCDRVPTGFLCIRRNIVEEMAEEAEKYVVKEKGEIPRLFYTYVNDKRQFIGEDFAWCDDYMRKYEKPISVWTAFDFEHDGRKGNYQDWICKVAVKVGDEEGVALTKPVETEEPARRLGKRDKNRSVA
jgi:hypothetical protein